MGVVQSSVIPTEAAAVGAALVAGTATAYAVYKRVIVDAEEKSASASASASASESKSNATTTTATGKKAKGKKKKTNDASEGNRSDTELDELLERAKAEAAAQRAQDEARRAASKLIPGAFDNDATSTTALSSEAEGSREKKKTRKKGKKAPGTGATSTTAANIGRDGGKDNKEVSASASALASSSKKPAESTTTSSAVQASDEYASASKKTKKRKGAAGSSKAGDAQVGSAAGATGSVAVAGSSTAGSANTKPSSNPRSLQSSQALGMSLTMSDAPEDASWTRVSTRKKAEGTAQQTDAELFTSDTNLTTSGVTDPEEDDEDEGSVKEPENRKTFAERMLPRPRKTGVEDMEDEPLQPTLARVIRVKPPSGEKPAKGFSWGDYEEYAHVEDGTSADGDADDVWEEVKSKKKSKLDRSASTLTSSADSLSFLSASAPPAPPSAPTKKQRQNAERREAAKQEKDAAERERQERRAKHRRELERERIAEQYAKSGSGSGGTKKNVSGGMKAAVEGGKLVWE